MNVVKGLGKDYSSALSDVQSKLPYPASDLGSYRMIRVKDPVQTGEGVEVTVEYTLKRQAAKGNKPSTKEALQRRRGTGPAESDSVELVRALKRYG